MWGEELGWFMRGDFPYCSGHLNPAWTLSDVIWFPRAQAYLLFGSTSPGNRGEGDGCEAGKRGDCTEMLLN